MKGIHFNLENFSPVKLFEICITYTQTKIFWIFYLRTPLEHWLAKEKVWQSGPQWGGALNQNVWVQYFGPIPQRKCICWLAVQIFSIKQTAHKLCSIKLCLKLTFNILCIDSNLTSIVNVHFNASGWLCWPRQAIPGDNLPATCIQDQIPRELFPSARQSRVRQYQQNLRILWWV